jgi:hypothetical protein
VLIAVPEQPDRSEFVGSGGVRGITFRTALAALGVDGRSASDLEREAREHEIRSIAKSREALSCGQASATASALAAMAFAEGVIPGLAVTAYALGEATFSITAQRA